MPGQLKYPFNHLVATFKASATPHCTAEFWIRLSIENKKGIKLKFKLKVVLENGKWL